MPTRFREPWLSFLREVDQSLKGPVEVHCLGGFVLSVMFDLPRPTGDVDIIEIRPYTAHDELLRMAGEGSELAEKYHLHFHRVTVAEYPEDYERRLLDITPRRFRRLRLKALEVHDVILAKLSRNSARDRADMEFLAAKGLLDRRLLEDRFERELRPQLLDETRGQRTLKLWVEEFLSPRSEGT
jgi:hypothetical protein